MTDFFLPIAETSDQAEGIYTQLAALCRIPVPPADQRIHEIRWTHDGDDWVATVGKPLSGQRVRLRKRKQGRVEITERLADPATVLAIFPGNPYLVVTNARPVGGATSSWENPFMAGIPSSVRLFEPPTPPK
jgi:hypothetical protein